jgi:hypothetical protein
LLVGWPGSPAICSKRSIWTKVPWAGPHTSMRPSNPGIQLGPPWPQGAPLGQESHFAMSRWFTPSGASRQKQPSCWQSMAYIAWRKMAKDGILLAVDGIHRLKRNGKRLCLAGSRWHNTTWSLMAEDYVLLAVDGIHRTPGQK